MPRAPALPPQASQRFPPAGLVTLSVRDREGLARAELALILDLIGRFQSRDGDAAPTRNGTKRLAFGDHMSRAWCLLFCHHKFRVLLRCWRHAAGCPRFHVGLKRGINLHNLPFQALIGILISSPNLGVAQSDFSDLLIFLLLAIGGCRGKRERKGEEGDGEQEKVFAHALRIIARASQRKRDLTHAPRVSPGR